MNSTRWNNTTKIVVATLLVVVVIWLLVLFRTMIAPTIVALLLAFVLSYPVSWVQRRTGWSRSTAVFSVYLILLALLALTPALVIPRLALLLDSLDTALQELVTDLQSAAAGPLFSIAGYEFNINHLLQQLGTSLQNIVAPAASNALAVARSFTTGVLSTVYVLVLSFWLLKDLHKLQRYATTQMPVRYSEDIHRLSTELGRIWNAFLRGQMLLALVVGIMTWIVMSIVGLPNAGGLALLAGVMEFLPTVGPGISGAIGTAVALFRGSTWLPIGNLPFAIIVLALYIVITQIESVYLIPRLVGRRVHLHPAITFAAIINAAIVFGVLGVLLATPTVASVRVLLSYLYRKLFDLEPFASQPQTHSAIQIRGMVGGHRIRGVIFSLDGTLTPPDLSLLDRFATQTEWLDSLWPCLQRRRFARRLLIASESYINRAIGFLLWLRLHQDLARIEPTLNRLRAYPQPEALQLLPGISDLLRTLHPYRLALVSTRPRSVLERFLQTSGVAPDTFAAIVAREDVRNPPPHSDAVTLASRQLGLEPDQLLMVGDTDVDLRAARAMGLATVGVLGGLGESNDLADANLVLEQLVDLAEWL